MATLSCRNLVKDCADTFSAADSTEIQKAFLVHIHAKHQGQWDQLSRQYRSVSLVAMRDRFLQQEAEGLKTARIS